MCVLQDAGYRSGPAGPSLTGRSACGCLDTPGRVASSVARAGTRPPVAVPVNSAGGGPEPRWVRAALRGSSLVPASCGTHIVGAATGT